MLLKDDTPVTEAALLASIERARFLHQPKNAKALQKVAVRSGITYSDDRGQLRYMPFGMSPVVIPRRTLRAIATCARRVQDAAVKLAQAWPSDAALRELLPLWPEEEDLFRIGVSQDSKRRAPVVARLDITLPVTERGIRDARFYEWNGSCIGGIYYASAGDEFVDRRVLSKLDSAGKSVRRRLDRQVDLCGLVHRELETWLLRSKTNGVVAVIEDPEDRAGITEYPALAKRFTKHGMHAICVDPRELEARGDTLFAKGLRVAVVLRNLELRDLVAIERRHGALHGVRLALRQDRVASSVAGELDHKSLWEVLNDPRWSRLVPASLRRHLPWTRLISARRTSLPGGRTGDLIRFVSKHRDRLVLKPNRKCGGEGIVIGPVATEKEWHRTIERAIRDRREGWVAQECLITYRKRLPLLTADQGVVWETVNSNVAVLACGGGEGLIVRVSRNPVVNVSRGGAQVAVLLS